MLVLCPNLIELQFPIDDPGDLRGIFSDTNVLRTLKIATMGSVKMSLVDVLHVLRMCQFGTTFKFEDVDLIPKDCLDAFHQFLCANQRKAKIHHCYLIDTEHNWVIHCMNDELMDRELWGNHEMSVEEEYNAQGMFMDFETEYQEIIVWK